MDYSDNEGGLYDPERPGMDDKEDDVQESMTREDFYAWLECSKAEDHMKHCDKHTKT